MSAYSNGSNTTRGSHGSTRSVGRWKLDEQKRKLREAKRRASQCVQEVKALKQECSDRSAAVMELEEALHAFQQQMDQLDVEYQAEQVSEADVKMREARKQVKQERAQLDAATTLLEARLEEQRVLYDQLLADEKAIQEAENEETSSNDAALQKELKSLSEEMLRLQGLCQEMHGVCNDINTQEAESTLVLQATDENAVSHVTHTERKGRGIDAALRKERDQLERELVAARAVADSIRREAEEKAASRNDQLALLTEELERLKGANAELSHELPLLTAQNHQLKDEQEAQVRRTEELQMTIDYMQEWQAVLKQKVARSTEKQLYNRGSAEKAASSIKKPVTAKRLEFGTDSPASPEYSSKSRSPKSVLREETAQVFIEGLERALVGSPVDIAVSEEEANLQQLVNEAEKDWGKERVRELEALVSKLTSELQEARASLQNEEKPVPEAGELETDFEQRWKEEQARREAAERRNEELARQLVDQAQFYSQSGQESETAEEQALRDVAQTEEDAIGVAGDSVAGPLVYIGDLEGKVADLSQQLSETAAAREEAEEAASELMDNLETLRAQYEEFRTEQRSAVLLKQENRRLMRRLTWRCVLAIVQVALFVYFTIAVAGRLGICGLCSPT